MPDERSDHHVRGRRDFLRETGIAVGALLAPRALIAVAALILSACDTGPYSSCECNHGRIHFTGPVVGCGDVIVARQSADSMFILHIRTLPSHFAHERDTTYEMSLGAGSSVVAYIESFASPQSLHSQVCDDVGGDDDPITVDTVTAGTIHVRAYDFSDEAFFRTFRVDVRLLNPVVDVHPPNDTVDMDSVFVGWLPG